MTGLRLPPSYGTISPLSLDSSGVNVRNVAVRIKGVSRFCPYGRPGTGRDEDTEWAWSRAGGGGELL